MAIRRRLQGVQEQQLLTAVETQAGRADRGRHAVATTLKRRRRLHRKRSRRRRPHAKRRGDNAELISSAHNPGQFRWVPRKGAVASTIQRRLLFFVHSFGVKNVAETLETQSQTEQPEPAAPNKLSSRKSILALAVFALAINGTAAIYTLPSFDIPLPDVSKLAELLPHRETPAPIPEAVVAALKDIQSAQEQHAVAVIAALKDIQSAQQQHAASLQDNGSSLQQTTALLQRDSTTLASLRASITDEHVDANKISAQLSKLIAKVDSLQNATTPEITSSISKGRGHYRLSGELRKRMARQPKPAGPVSIGGAPLSYPVTPAPQG